MKKQVLVTLITLVLLFLALGCQNPLETKDLAAMAKVAGDKKDHPVPGGEVPSKGDLIAGRTIKVGTVTVTNDTENIYVKYFLTDGWEMTKSQVAVALSLGEIPQTKKHNPIPSQFAFKKKYHPAVTEITYSIPLRDSGYKAGDLLYIAAHARVRNSDATGKENQDESAWDAEEEGQEFEGKNGANQKESAWAAGEPGQEFEGKNRATYFCYVVVIERIWEGDFEIQRVDDLAGYTGITGSLTIRETNLPNLAWLSSLTFVGGNLNIEYNSALTSLTGLEGLTSISGSLSIWDNSTLTTLAALESLTAVQGNLVIRDNPSLTDLTGLESLIAIGGGLFIIENNVLASLNMLNSLTSIGGWLSISSTRALVNLVGLEGLTSVGGYLEIGNNYALTSLTGLDNLNSVGGLVISGYNGVLENLTGLDGLVSVINEVDIRHNTALISLAGLNSLESIGGDLKIRYNDNLASLIGLGKLDSIGSNLEITDNPYLPTSLAEDLALQVKVAGSITIERNAP
jgi:hypothetical protein